jgi:hypothetical protein
VLAGPINTDNSSSNRVHIAATNDSDEFNVCPEDENHFLTKNLILHL